jgi:hypothetical protein
MFASRNDQQSVISFVGHYCIFWYTVRLKQGNVGEKIILGQTHVASYLLAVSPVVTTSKSPRIANLCRPRTRHLPPLSLPLAKHCDTAHLHAQLARPPAERHHDDQRNCSASVCTPGLSSRQQRRTASTTHPRRSSPIKNNPAPIRYLA